MAPTIAAQETTTPNATPPKIKLAYGLLTLLLIVLVAEVVSFLLLSLSEKRWMTYRRVHEAQSQVATDSVSASEQEPTERLEVDLRHEVVHPYLGFVLDREHRGPRRYELGGQQALDHGFELRSDGLLHTPTADKPVIVFMGGSVAFELAAAAGGTLADELLQGLGIEDGTIVNLALPGYKQPQQLMTLSYFLALGAHFDVVINLDGFNEITLPASENLPTGVDPFFPRLWKFRAQELDTPLRIALGELAFLDAQRSRSAAYFAALPYRSSLTAGLLWTVLDRRLTQWAYDRELEVRSARERSKDASTGIGRSMENRTDEATYRDHAQLWQRASGQMHDLAQGKGILYFHFLQPNQYLADSKPMSPEERRTAIQPGHAYGRHAAVAYPLLIEYGRQLSGKGIRFTDLTAIFTEVKEPVYRDACCHLNDLGQTLLMRGVTSTIRPEVSRIPPV